MAAMDPASNRSGRPPAQALGMLVACVAVLAYFVWQVGPLAKDLSRGVPAIEQLRRVEGAVRSWRGCHVVGRHSSGEDVTLASATGAVEVPIPCVLPAGSLSDGQPHRMTVLLQDTASVGPLACEVTLDGRTLLAYADERRRRAGATRLVLAAAAVAFGLVLLVVFAAARAFLRSLREPGDEDRPVPPPPRGAASPAQSDAQRRAAALAMLAAGNSAHAVASVFGVTQAQLAQWEREPRA